MKLAYPVATPEVRATIFGAASASADMLLALRDIGYGAIEPFVADPAAFDADAWIRDVQRSGLAIAAIGTGPVVFDDHLAFTHPAVSMRRAAIDRAKAIVRFAAQLDAQVNIGKLRGDIEASAADQTRAWMRAAFEEVCGYAAEAGVIVTIEPQGRAVINNINTTAEALAWLRELAQPNLRLMLDVFHMEQMGEDIAASFAAAHDVLLHVHFADTERRVPGAGSLDFHAVTKQLRAIGYDRAITVEVKQHPSVLEAARRSASFLLPLIA
ncbi:MAG: TIM barrel protein [Opitutaceae bacterium]